MTTRPSSEIVAAIGGPASKLDRLLTKRGYELQPTTRPYLKSSGHDVTVRLVWHHREHRTSIVYTMTLATESSGIGL